jgi:signal transduction histidine kinase
MPTMHGRVTPWAWLRLPRRTARLRLTLLYSALFLLTGVVLLAITYVLFRQALDGQDVKVPRGTPSPPVIRQPGHALQHQGQPPASAAKAAQQIAAEHASVLHELLINSGIALAIATVLALLLGWFVAGRMLQPVRTITATARRISASNLQERLALDDADEEFKDLGDTLDDLFARLQGAFEAQRHFVANASHELRTPLTRERTLLQVALGDPSTSDVWQHTVQEVLASNREQERLIEALLALATSESGLDHRERIDLSVICDDVLLRPDLDIDSLGLNVETTIGPAPLDGDPKLIERLVANLVDNAVDHNVMGGHVQVSTTVTSGNAVLSVTNTGPVISPNDIDRLFQPFQRLDASRTHHKDGHGLGLSIVKAVAAAHGANIAAQPVPGGGLLIEVTFAAPITGDYLERAPSGVHRPASTIC